MANGKTFTVTEQLNSEEDYDALQEVTAELEQAEARIVELEDKLVKAVITLKLLVDVSVMMQSATSHNKHRHNTVITDTVWAQWSKQLKYTRTILAELEGQDDDR